MQTVLIDILRLTIWLAILVAVFVPLERFFALRPAKVWRAQIGVDLGWYFINALTTASIVALPIAALARVLHGVDPYGLYTAIGAWPLWLKLLAALLVNDVGAYWVHRWQHHNRFLWRFHAVHHSAKQVDWLVNTRAHPIDLVTERLGGLVPVYLCGLGSPTGGEFQPVAALVMIFGTLWTFFIHANVWWRLGPLEWLISTPAFHHWHHTNDAHRDRNFAAIFPWLDRLFGTNYLPKNFPPVYGIDAPMAETLLGQFVDPFFEPVKLGSDTLPE